MEPDNLRLDHYVLTTARVRNPVVCFVPTASGDAEEYIGRFYASFSRLPQDIAGFLSECDIIYVGGGNTRNLMVVWRERQVDALLRRAWETGVVLCGLSAGAFCWCEHGLTDSAGPLTPMRCLGFLPGSCAPHYDGQPDRRPAFQSCIQRGSLPARHALDDGAAIHWVGRDIAEILSSRPQARVYRLRAENGQIVEQALETRLLPAP